jgi:hypothetical protein
MKLTIYHHLVLKIIKQAFNVALRCIHGTNATVENHKYYIFGLCVCSLGHPPRHVHAPCYIATRGLSGCTIFFHIISKTTRLLPEPASETFCFTCTTDDVIKKEATTTRFVSRMRRANVTAAGQANCLIKETIFTYKIY